MSSPGDGASASGQRVVGLVGVGLVGTSLAELLLDRGFDVVGYDIDGARMGCLEDLGGRPARSVAEVARAARRIVLSLMDSDVVWEVVAGAGGILEVQDPPDVIIDTTTGDPDRTAALAGRLAGDSVAFLDATISGSSRQIRQRAAVYMVGGDRRAYDSCRDLFDAFGGRAYYLGPSGAGSKAKLASNVVLGLNRLVLAEGLVFAERLGLDLPRFLEVLKASPAYSVAMDVKGEKMLRGDFEPQSRIRQHRKDVGIILSYAQAARQQMPLSEAHLDILDAAIAAGDGDLDNAAVIRELRRSGVEARHAAMATGPARASAR